MLSAIHPDAIASLLSGDHGAPFDLLGPHPVSDNQVSIRAFRPSAQSLTLIDEQTKER